MAKRDLTPEYRAGAEAFADLYGSLRQYGPDALYFSEISVRIASAKRDKPVDFCLGFDEAIAVLIEEVATGMAPSVGWSPMRDLEDPDWWREDEPEGGANA
ncbi:hypothetical protein [Burkholderia glumae]|uniref:hypothetical protein n=1 Tax=Burkholderia glumae TaxID=337 RepID=UPI002151CF54|nr:hypothetical protein [Burkholderia glumae]